MNTKAQDTVHAKYYKQQIRQSMLYSKTRQESQALYEAGIRGELMRSGTKYSLQKELYSILTEKREEVNNLCTKGICQSIDERIEYILKDMERRKREGDSFVKLIMSTKQLVDSTARHRQFIIEHDMI